MKATVDWEASHFIVTIDYEDMEKRDDLKNNIVNRSYMGYRKAWSVLPDETANLLAFVERYDDIRVTASARRRLLGKVR